MLHAAAVELDHPREGRRLKDASPVPEVFAQVAQQAAAAPPAAARFRTRRPAG